MRGVRFYIFEHLVRSGRLNINIGHPGTLDYSGVESYTWSQFAVDTNNAYLLLFNVNVNPSNGPFGRTLGYPLRCLSTALEG